MEQAESWQEKFFKLAELYLQQSALLGHAHSKLTISRGELLLDFNNRLNPDQQEALRSQAKNDVSDVIEGKSRGSEPVRPGRDRVVEMRKKQRSARPNLSRGLGL